MAKKPLTPEQTEARENLARQVEEKKRNQKSIAHLTDNRITGFQAGRVLRRPDVEQITGLSRSTIYAMIAEGEFPKPVKLGKRAVGWREADIAAWLDSRTTEAV